MKSNRGRQDEGTESTPIPDTPSRESARINPAVRRLITLVVEPAFGRNRQTREKKRLQLRLVSRLYRDLWTIASLRHDPHTRL